MSVVSDPVELECYVVISNDGKVDSIEKDSYWVGAKVDRLNKEFDGTGRVWSAAIMKVAIPPEVFQIAFVKDEKPPVSLKFDFFKWFR